VNKPGSRPSYSAYHISLCEWDFPSSFALTLLALKPVAKLSLFRNQCLSVYLTLQWSQHLPRGWQICRLKQCHTPTAQQEKQLQGILRIWELPGRP